MLTVVCMCLCCCCAAVYSPSNAPHMSVTLGVLQVRGGGYAIQLLLLVAVHISSIVSTSDSNTASTHHVCHAPHAALLAGVPTYSACWPANHQTSKCLPGAMRWPPVPCKRMCHNAAAAAAAAVTPAVLCCDQMLANHYPERLYKAYICNAPSIFSLAFKVGCSVMCM